MRRHLVNIGALSWALLIFLLSAQPASSYEGAGDALEFLPAAEFLVHVFLYFVLALLVHAVLRAYLPKRKNLLALDTVVFALLYGVSDEFHQAFVPGRSASAVDVLADVLGAILAVTLWFVIVRFKERRRNRDSNGRQNED